MIIIMIKRCFALALLLLATSPVMAEEETWTDLGIYLFAIEIEGDGQIRNVTADVDVGFDDIVDNLDFGYMAYIEHRRGKWSFLGDIAYLNVSDDKSTASDKILQVELDGEVEQTVFEGFVGYRILEREYDAAVLGLDLFIGARYTALELDLSSEATALGLTRSSFRERDEDWTDAVLALRLQYGGRKGWGSSFWVDVGDGSDSSSEQFMALATYRGDSNWKFFGGYRYLNLEYEKGSGTSKFAVDLDYTGPMFGAAYRM
jgi:hypothetical protein